MPQQSKQSKNQQHPNIIKTLKKIQDLAVFINASLQCWKLYNSVYAITTILILSKKLWYFDNAD
ncbi:uncharacterized protein ANIA_11538 [Aspergillus nidulans FGSC A4]|uniref:Uncharacterized protein n=1 Tax=Emericella nidulans (strain FGSC A4 / ATCC 38163 / CBS 112.46 / NRRL 194 / M139) TaxID=227321 RepID=C8V3F8_EMENI|nr:hypothetical protein [Aspergillus nidulans FGSC A4]CBF71858.1 TPA: hypothetical protein ANIA_11538 [Aspergillus nidulans FGSC A4]